MKCKVGGCDKQLDEYGWPIEYCEYQQGRCPHKKAKLSNEKCIIFGFLFILLGVVFSWLTT
jgi:hypothetical protein